MTTTLLPQPGTATFPGLRKTSPEQSPPRLWPARTTATNASFALAPRDAPASPASGSNKIDEAMDVDVDDATFDFDLLFDTGSGSRAPTPPPTPPTLARQLPRLTLAESAEDARVRCAREPSEIVFRPRPFGFEKTHIILNPSLRRFLIILVDRARRRRDGETASHTTPFAWCTPFLKDFSLPSSSSVRRLARELTRPKNDLARAIRDRFDAACLEVGPGEMGDDAHVERLRVAFEAISAAADDDDDFHSRRPAAASSHVAEGYVSDGSECSGRGGGSISGSTSRANVAVAPGSTGRAALLNLRHAFLWIDVGGGGAAATTAAAARADPSSSDASPAPPAPPARDDETTLILEPDIRAHFVVSRPTEAYSRLLRSLHERFVGTRLDLAKLVDVVCDEMRASFDANGMSQPPWRRPSSIMSKWLVPAQSCVGGARDDAAGAGGTKSARARSDPATKPLLFATTTPIFERGDDDAERRRRWSVDGNPERVGPAGEKPRGRGGSPTFVGFEAIGERVGAGA